MTTRTHAITILKWALAFVFFYAAVSGLRHPYDWIGYFPAFLQNQFPPRTLLSVFGVYEFLLAGWLFWGRKLIWSSMLAFLTLAGIVVSTLNQLELTFRDVGLALAALALFELARERKKILEENR